MLDPTSPTQLDRLYRAIEWSRWKLQSFRQNRLEALRQFVGAHYSESGSTDRVPVNLLQLACMVYLRQLVARAPRAMVTSRQQQLKPVAADMQAWMDRATVGMRLAESLRLWVLNALFSIGVMKVGEAHVGDIVIQGTTQHIGQPFAEVVDLDDWVHDITAKRFDHVQFCGNRYRVHLEEAKENPLFDETARARLAPMTRFAYNERGDVRTSTLSQSTQQFIDEYTDHVELWDIWLPREKLVLTIPYQESVEGGLNGPPLRVVKWQGPEQGPFVILSFADVPNNVMPAAPAQSWLDLHDLANRMWRKLGRQAERQKTVLGVMGSATEDGERIVKAEDGQAIRIDNPDRSREYRFGGIDAQQLLGAEQVKNLFVYLAGNLDALGGLSPQAATLGQDELLNKNSAAQVAEMQDRTISGTQEVYQRLAYWWWTNPVLTYNATRQVMGQDVPVSITPQMRQVPFEALDFRIDPYSMQHSTPQTRLTLLLNMLQTVLLPSAPMMAQQGVTIKWPGIVSLLAKYGDFPDLEDILAIGPPPAQAGAFAQAQQAVQGAQQDATPKPAMTTRREVRESRPGMTRQGQSDVMQQLLAGGGQPKQAGMMGRGLG